MIPIAIAGHAIGLVELASSMPMRAEGTNELLSAPFPEFYEVACLWVGWLLARSAVR